MIFIIWNFYHPGDYFPRDYTRFRLNRKRLLIIKERTSEETSGTTTRYMISNPKPAESYRDRPGWVNVAEVRSIDSDSRSPEPGPYGVAR